MTSLFDEAAGLAAAKPGPHQTSRGHPASALPAYECSGSSAGADGPIERDLIRLTCPRKDCGDAFWIGEQYAFDHADEARPCPYCFRAARLP